MGIFGGILDAVGGFVGGALSYRGAKKAKIGRASCRERVCLYV